MPALTHIAPKGQQADPFESPYRAETSFKSFSTFLNRQLTVHSNTPNQYAKFSVLDMLKHINLKQATLKGSTVKHWESDKAPADVDLQLPCKNSIDKKTVTRGLIEFLNARSNHVIKNSREIKEKTWFARVRHDLGDSWVRLIVSVGYPQRNASTLDLNFTNYRGIAHDAIHASQAIQFDWASHKAFKIGAWHPNLVDWLQKNQLLWFKPNIDDGLGRLSYRLSKSPNARLLQPDLLDHFCEQASHASLCDVYMRALQGEYPRCALSEDDQATLWKSIIAAVENSANKSLQNDLLAWSKFNTLAQLHEALGDADTKPIVLDQLTQATKIGLDFKKNLKEFLTSHEEIAEPIKALIGKALGAEMVQGERLFEMLDSWGSIQEVPEPELQTVFSDLLKSLTQSANPALVSRANNMLGWLNGDELSSLKFLIDRIPEQHHSAPPDKLMKPVMQAMLHIIKTQGANALGPALAQLNQLRISQAGWQALVKVLLKVPAKKVINTAEYGKEKLTAEFMNILIKQSATLSTFTHDPGTTTQASYQNFHQQIMDYLDTLDAQTTPPMLRNVIQFKSDGIEITLPDMALAVSRTQRSITAKSNAGKYFVTAYGHGGLTKNEKNNPDDFKFYWHDGSIVMATQSGTTSNPRLEGTLSRLNKNPLPSGFVNLLGTARTLCANQFRGLLHEHEFWTAKGVFIEKQILKASGLMEALLAMKQGSIVDQALNHHLQIKYDINDGKPVSCTVNIVEEELSTQIRIPFQGTSSKPGQSAGLSNPWGVEPVMNKVEYVQKIHTPGVGPIDVSTTLHWSDEIQTLEGTEVVKGSGPVKFKWQGNMTLQGLAPDGALYLEKQKIPAIVFSSARSTSNIPVSLLPIMADLLGQHFNGSYPFSATVWEDPHRWPIQGFEGFIDRYAYKNYLFSGYLTSTGRAIGILRNIADPDKIEYSAWAGAFYVRHINVLNYKEIKLDQQPESLSWIPLTAHTNLTPHGFVREFKINTEDNQKRASFDRIYFCGENIRIGTTTRNQELIYDSPNATHYFCGINYTLDQKQKGVDMVFNPGDGGDDFMIVRPKDYERLSSYQELYRDSNGNSATLVVLNNQYRLIDATFASGLEYKGEVERQGNFIKPVKTGTLSFNGLSFTANFEKDNTISQIKAKNSATSTWLTDKGFAGEHQRINLNEWMRLISNGHLDWQKDLQTHLRIRELNSLMAEGTIFSR